MIIHGCNKTHHKDCGDGLLNGVQGFINFTTSIIRNFSGDDIRYICRKCKNKKHLHTGIQIL